MLLLVLKEEERKKSPVKEETKVEEPVIVIKEVKDPYESRIREYLWRQLRLLYEAFIMGRELPLTELRALVLAINGDFTELELTNIITGLYEMPGPNITFIEFVISFLILGNQILLPDGRNWSQ